MESTHFLEGDKQRGGPRSNHTRQETRSLWNETKAKGNGNNRKPVFES